MPSRNRGTSQTLTLCTEDASRQEAIAAKRRQGLTLTHTLPLNVHTCGHPETQVSRSHTRLLGDQLCGATNASVVETVGAVCLKRTSVLLAASSHRHVTADELSKKNSKKKIINNDNKKFFFFAVLTFMCVHVRSRAFMYIHLGAATTGRSDAQCRAVHVS